jgi:hypothetical protein
MSIIDLQESLKDVSDDGLMEAFRSGSAPQFLVLGELQRRKRMRDDFKRREAADMPTVAEEMITGAGVPQEGLMTLASALTPNTALSQDTGIDQAMPMQATRAPQQPQMAADGGILNLFTGGRTREDLYRRVEPFPEDGTAAERRNWTLTYGMTHDADGMPKRMLPDVATIDVSPTIDYKSPFFNPDAAEVSTDLDDFMPKVSDDTIIPRTQTSPISPSSVVGDLPFLPSPTELAETESERLLREDVEDFNRTRNVLTEPELSMNDLMRQAKIEREGFGASTKDQLSLQEQLANSLGFAVDADERNEMMGRLENIDTPPPSVLAAQTDDTSSGNDELAEYLKKEREDYNKILAERGPENTAGKDSLKRLLVRPPVAEFLNSFGGESTVPSGISGDDPYDEVSPTTIADDAKKLAEDKIAPKADEYRGDDPLTFIDSSTDGGEGGAGFGSPESEMSKLLADRRKRADQNKWLALAEAGFAMMGPAATFGQGIAKGGQAGLKALRESQKGLDAFETDMLKLQASLDIADARNQTTIQAAQIRGDNALAAAMLRKKDPAITASALSAAQARVNEARDVLANAVTQADKVAADAALQEAIAIRDEFTRIYSGQIGANIASNTAGSTGGIKDVDLTT